MGYGVAILSAASGTAGTAAGTAWGPGMTIGTLYNANNPHGTQNMGQHLNKMVVVDHLGTGTMQITGTIYGRSGYPGEQLGNWYEIANIGFCGSGAASAKQFQDPFLDYQVVLATDGDSVPFKVTVSCWPA